MTVFTHLADDLPLLQSMLADMELQPSLYRPGPYWEPKARAAVWNIEEHGLADFRGASSLIGLSFADNAVIDWRKHLRGSIKRQIFSWILYEVFPFNWIYGQQVDLTRQYFFEALSCTEEILRLNNKVTYLLQHYQMPYSLLGGCISKVNIDHQGISVHYLRTLNEHHCAAQIVDFTRPRSVLEIGGGFGVNMHLLLTNYRNIRKVIYLDIPPNLYVGTQYLRAFFGSSIIDYRELKRRNCLRFSADDELEILCIAPWQIELLESATDLFINSHSFVEMPEAVVQNYADKAVNRFSGSKTAIVLASYEDFDVKMTMHPDKLPGFFKSRKDFEKIHVESLIPRDRTFMFISRGPFGRITEDVKTDAPVGENRTSRHRKRDVCPW